MIIFGMSLGSLSADPNGTPQLTVHVQKTVFGTLSGNVEFELWGDDGSGSGFIERDSDSCEGTAGGKDIYLHWTGYEGGGDVNFYVIESDTAGATLVRCGSNNSVSITGVQTDTDTVKLDQNKTVNVYFKNWAEGEEPEKSASLDVDTETCEEVTLTACADEYNGEIFRIRIREEGVKIWDDRGTIDSNEWCDGWTIPLVPGDYEATFNIPDEGITITELFTVIECTTPPPPPPPTATVTVAGIMNYTITASSGSGGSISDEGVTTLNEGDDKAYTMHPEDGYEISDVMVDGVSVGAVESYSFMDVAADHTIYVDFGIIGTVEPAAVVADVEVLGVTEELPYTGMDVTFLLLGFAALALGSSLLTFKLVKRSKA
ncbi:MAG: cold shock domain-containing protein [Actinomycetia bacterium]|nr:cold shock domain-containing protein [Actinomycetes bacterium]